MSRYGIHLFNLTYFDGALGLLIYGQGQRRTVRYDPNDLSAVFLQMSDGGHLRVAYANLERPAATLWEHRLAMRALLQDGRRAVNEDAIFEAIKQQREVLAASAATSKAARRASTRSREARRTYRDHRPDEDARGDEELESSPSLDPADHWRTESWS